MTYRVLVTSVIKTTSFNERTSNSLHIPIPLLPSQTRDFDLCKLLYHRPLKILQTQCLYFTNTLTQHWCVYLNNTSLLSRTSQTFSLDYWNKLTIFISVLPSPNIIRAEALNVGDTDCLRFQKQMGRSTKKSQPHAQISHRFLQLALLFLTRWPCTAGGCTRDRYNDGCHPSTSALNSGASVTCH